MVNLNGLGAKVGESSLFGFSSTLVNAAGGRVTADGAGGKSIDGLNFINAGTVTARAGAALDVSATNFSNAGTVVAEDGATVTVTASSLTHFVGASYGVDDGEIQIGDGLQALTLPTSTLVFGDGLIDAALTTNGDLSPGFSAGELRIDDGLTLLADSRTLIEIGGLLPGTEHDLVTVLNGPTNLDGELVLSLIGGFTPTGADTFDILTGTMSGGISGTWDNAADGGTIAFVGGTFQLDYLSDRVQLSNFVIPEPATAGLLAASLLLPARRRR